MGNYLSSDKRILFLVTSVMKPWNAEKFDYGGERSVFSAEERVCQTIETVRSIRQRVPYADIVIVEGGEKLDKKTITVINSMGVRILYPIGCLGFGGIVKYFVSGKSKALGEIVLMLSARFVLRSFREYDYIFKISGRYRLNSNFDITRWRMDKICGKDIYEDRTQISTRLIGIPKSLVGKYYKAIFRRIWKLPFHPVVLEGYLLKGIGLDNICFFSPIGVEGLGGSYHEQNLTIE